jgi:hypothetical protein
VRAAAVLLLMTTMLASPSPEASSRPPLEPAGTRLAQLGASAAGVFLSLVNERIKGRIDPRSVSYVAPAGILLEDTVLSGPTGKPVARVKRALAQVSLKALFSGELVISRIELDEPKLLLENEADGTLNLLAALAPKTPPPADADPADTTFQIGDIIVRAGGFRFTDGDHVTVTLDDISAHASVDVDLGKKTVVVDVDHVGVEAASVKLPTLDVPLRQLTAERIRVITDTIEFTNVRGMALPRADAGGARVVVNGRIDTKSPGQLRLEATVDASAGLWPERLEPLPFVTPSLRGRVAVNGPFASPVIDVDGTVGSTTLAGYAVDGGQALVRVTTEQVTLREGTMLSVGRGSVAATGTVRFPNGDDDAALDLTTVVTSLPLGVALAPAELETLARGTVSGTLKVTGRAGTSTELTVQGSVHGQGLQLYDLALPTQLDGDLRLTISPQAIQLNRVTLKDSGETRVAVDGRIDLEGKRLALSVSAALERTSSVVTQLPRELIIGKAQATGTVSGPFQDVVTNLVVAVDSLTAWGVSGRAVRADVRVSSRELRVEHGVGVLADGALSQRAPCVLTFGKKATTFSSGTFFVRHAALGTLRTVSGKPLPLAGVVDVEVRLRGTTTRPRVPIRAAGAGVVVSGEALGEVTAALVATKEALVFSSASISSPLVTARARELRLNVDDLRLIGSVDVSAVDLARVQAARKASLLGRGRGTVTFNGPVSTPTLQANLTLRGLGVAGIALGDGPVTLTTSSDPGGSPDSLLVTVASMTSSTGGSFEVRGSYAVDRETLAADVRLRDVDLAGLVHLPSSIAPLDGVVEGAITLSGPLSAPHGVVRVRIPELAVSVRERGATAEPATTRLRTLGSVALAAELRQGQLVSRVCAFPVADAPLDADPDNPCGGRHRIWAALAGRVDLSAGAAALSVDGVVEEARLEELIVALADRELGLGGRARLHAVIDAPATGASSVEVLARVEALEVRPPGAPVITLTRPVDVAWRDGHAIIGEEAARFSSARDELDLVIAGGSSVGADDVDVRIDGQVALAALKLLTDEVANASGTAETHLRVRGRFVDGVAVEGGIAPQTGARITLRSFGQPLVFEQARVSFLPDERDRRRLLVTLDGPCGDPRAAACPLRAQLGEGRVQVRGSVLARTSRDEGSSWIDRFDVAMSATGLELKTSLGRVGAGFDVSLKGDAPAPMLSGRVDITDGLLRKEFQVRNFILSQEPVRPSDPLWLRLAPYGLGELGLDVTASMQNVRTKARINAFSIDASMRGELRISRTLKFPGVDGAIEVESGVVDFPRARFDIVEMQLQFPTSADGAIKPLLHLSARAELAPGSAGNTVEVPVDLNLDGSFDAMQLDLAAQDPNRQWTRSELFAYVLFGIVPAQAGGADLVGTSVEVASRAALRELTAPVNREVEALLESNLGVDFNIDLVSGFQVQLGRRVVLEGPGLQALALTDSTASATSIPNAASGTEAVRVRLLFYDHFPVGRAFSLDGRIGLLSDARLTWRVYEQ